MDWMICRHNAWVPILVIRFAFVAILSEEGEQKHEGGQEEEECAHSQFCAEYVITGPFTDGVGSDTTIG